MAKPWWPWSTAFPPASTLSAELIDAELHRRQGGYGRGGRQKLEADHVDILSGMWRGQSIGSPIALLVRNNDYKIEQMDELPRPRPGHGDLSGSIKYLGSIRGVLERASAAKRPPASPPEHSPSNCSRPSASPSSATWWRLGPMAVPVQPGTLAEQRALRDRSALLHAQPRPGCRADGRSSTRRQ